MAGKRKVKAVQVREDNATDATNPQTPARPRCPAKRSNGLPCGNVAGFATPHEGTGLCRYHGGMIDNTGNTHGVVTHEHQSLIASLLPPSARKVYETATTSPVEALTESIALTAAREALMLEELEKVRGEYAASLATTTPGMGVTEITDRQSGEFPGRDIKYETMRTTVLRIEEALTRVQTLKARQSAELARAQDLQRQAESGVNSGTTTLIHQLLAVNVSLPGGMLPGGEAITIDADDDD